VLATDLALALDPVLLARRAGFEPDAWQAALLRSDARQMILLCSRQSGKSSVSAFLALHEALYHSPALVLILSPTLRQSAELFRKVKETHAALGDVVSRASEESAQRLEFSNGSRVVCLSGDGAVRGYSGVALLVVDEGAWVKDALYQSVRPMLAVSGGRIILLSTPFGQRGFFHHEWTEGGDDWQRVKITADQCPRIPRAWLERERLRNGDWWHRQEYLCEFVADTDSYFRWEDIDAALVTDALPLPGFEVIAA